MCANEMGQGKANKMNSPLRATTPIRRKKLWQLDAHFHCSVIGTCVSLDELRRICQKIKIKLDSNVGNYELHRGFVSLADEPCDATRLLHKHLDRKYKRSIETVAKFSSEDAFRDFWTASLKIGQVAGPYWALVTHPQVPNDLLQYIYGDVHMLSHLSGASVRVDMQKLSRLQQRNRDLEKQLTETKATNHQQLTKHLKTQVALKTQLAQAKTTQSALKDAHLQLDSLKNDPLANRLQAKLDTLSDELIEAKKRAHRAETVIEEWRQSADSAQNHTNELANQLTETCQERDALEKMLNRLSNLDPGESCPAQENNLCSGTSLCGRCILYVGGRYSQCSQFRTLVERQNGRFLHHDGGREDSRQRLGTILSQADAVLCPLDCVSHDAVNRVKRFCENYAKPLVLLPHASLSAFARGLETLAA
jgi:hypothetical protein